MSKRKRLNVKDVDDFVQTNQGAGSGFVGRFNVDFGYMVFTRPPKFFPQGEENEGKAQATEYATENAGSGRVGQQAVIWFSADKDSILNRAVDWTENHSWNVATWLDCCKEQTVPSLAKYASLPDEAIDDDGFFWAHLTLYKDVYTKKNGEEKINWSPVLTEVFENKADAQAYANKLKEADGEDVDFPAPTEAEMPAGQWEMVKGDVTETLNSFFASSETAGDFVEAGVQLGLPSTYLERVFAYLSQ